MTQLFSASEYAQIHSLVFRDDYPGYKPNVIESPNGDGKLDTEKRYAHVAEKYILRKRYNDKGFTIKTAVDYNDRMSVIEDYLDRAHNLALEVAVSIGVPREFWPSRKYSALRVLEYGPTAITHAHTDFDLFTLMCYRNDESCFKYLNRPNTKTLAADGLEGYAKEYALMNHSDRILERVKSLNSQIHFGELIEEIDSSSFRATKHQVVASNGPWQYSCVYFAVPEHDAVLPSGITVGQWMDERKSRSRYER